MLMKFGAAFSLHEAPVMSGRHYSTLMILSTYTYTPYGVVVALRWYYYA